MNLKEVDSMHKVKFMRTTGHSCGDVDLFCIYPVYEYVSLSTLRPVISNNIHTAVKYNMYTIHD